MPLAIDRKDEKENITRGSWNSLSEILGVFDAANNEIIGRYFTSQHGMPSVLTTAPSSLAHNAAIALNCGRLEKM